MININRILVIKRNGKEERFDIGKLRKSIEKVLRYANINDSLDEVIESVINDISSFVKKNNSLKVKSTDIAEFVEKALVSKIIENPFYEKAARAYVLGRIYNHVFGKGSWKKFDELDERFAYTALRVLNSRYLRKDPKTGRIIETPKMLMWRVAKSIAEAEDESKRDYWAKKFFELLINRKFIPNSPTLMNAGTRLGILSACFVIPVRDSMVTERGDGIYDAVRAQAIIFQQGGGTGFNFSELRPKGDVVASTSGVASGPLSFMKIFDLNTEVIKQGGRRRGANMGVLHVWHSDIRDFIKAKSGKLKDVHLQNFNISVGVYDYFMHAIKDDAKVPLINPRKTSIDGSTNSLKYAIVWARYYINEEWVQEIILKELEKRGGSVPLDESLIITWDEALAIAESEDAITDWVSAHELFEEIVSSAWDSGDPGLLFIDTINRRHPTWYLGKINATNPCGEEPLLEWESCNLGSINLEKYVTLKDGKPTIDWDALAKDVKVAVRFLDNVISVAKYPLKQLAQAAQRTRKIGLGVMGWAHTLIKLGIPFDSVDALYLAYYLAEWIAYNAYLASIELAKEKGTFPAWDPELYRPHWWTAMPLEKMLKIAGIKDKPSSNVLRIINSRPKVDWRTVEEGMKKYGLRNAALLSIAPTGTISIIAGTSSGIEPIFALAFIRVVTVGTFIEVNPLFLEKLAEYGLDEPEVLKTIAETGTIAHNPFMPKPLRRVFRTAHDIEPIWHVLHQAVWQQWVDAGVSKTVNMRAEATKEDVRRVYILAWALGCKGITIYRDKSKSRQVIYFGVKLSKELVKRGAMVPERESISEKVTASKPLSEFSKESSTAYIVEGREGSSVERHASSEGARYRLAPQPIKLKDGDIGDCSTCEY